MGFITTTKKPDKPVGQAIAEGLEKGFDIYSKITDFQQKNAEFKARAEETKIKLDELKENQRQMHVASGYKLMADAWRLKSLDNPTVIKNISDHFQQGGLGQDFNSFNGSSKEALDAMGRNSATVSDAAELAKVIRFKDPTKLSKLELSRLNEARSRILSAQQEADRLESLFPGSSSSTKQAIADFETNYNFIQSTIQGRYTAEFEQKGKERLKNIEGEWDVAGKQAGAGLQYTPYQKTSQEKAAASTEKMRDVVTKSKAQIDDLDDAMKQFEEYSKTLGGSGPLATGFGLTGFITKKSNKMKASFKKIAFQDLVTQLAGFSKSVDSPGERMMFEAKEPALGNEDATNWMLMLGAKSQFKKVERYLQERDQYAALKGSTEGYMPSSLTTYVDKNGEMVVVKKNSEEEDAIKQDENYVPLAVYEKSKVDPKAYEKIVRKIAKTSQVSKTEKYDPTSFEGAQQQIKDFEKDYKLNKQKYFGMSKEQAFKSFIEEQQSSGPQIKLSPAVQNTMSLFKVKGR